MNKITKLFLVILSAVSMHVYANAGELTVTGGATATMVQGNDHSAHGKALGVSNEIDFTATGELDNGFSWKWQAQMDGATNLNDDTRLEVGTPYGTVAMYISEGDLSSKLGYGIGAMGVGSDYTGPTSVLWGATMNSYNNIGYSSPAGLLPYGMTVKAAYAPNLASTQGSSAKADGTATTTASDNIGDSAQAFRVDFVPQDGLKIGADYMTTKGGEAATRYNQASGGAYVQYKVGAYTIGAARAVNQPDEDYAATIGSDGSVHYVTDQYGVQFAVNDAISVSYSEERSTKENSTTLSGAGVRTQVANVDMKVKHYQAAYVVGGATLGLAIAEASDSDYVANRKENTTTLSVAMAF